MTSDMPDSLKPCPFCKGEAKLHDIDDEVFREPEYDCYDWWVSCLDCGATGPNEMIDLDNHTTYAEIITEVNKCRAEAVRKWNIRI